MTEPKKFQRITLDLPMPPSVNRLWRIGKDKRSGKRMLYRSPEYEKWLTSAGWELVAQKSALPVKSISGLYSLIVRVKQTKGDLDNLLKATNDLLQTHGIISNDRLCRKILILFDEKLPVACRVTIRSIARS